MGNLVSLVDSGSNNADLVSSLSKSFDLIGFNPARKVKEVIIKPNLNYYWEPSTGATTDPRLVGALIDYLHAKYGEDINIKVAEADATAMRTKHVFKILGYDKLAESKKVELFNLANDTLKKEKVQVNGQEIEFEAPQTLMTSDLFINVPKLKMMRVTKISCAMKNLFGANGTVKKLVYHKFLDETIVGINKVLKPNVTLVDGLVALGRYPVKLGLLIASEDVFSIDWAVAKIIGYNPRSVRFLKIAEKEGVGNHKGIQTVGEDLKKYLNKVPGEKFPSQQFMWKIEFGLLRMYRKVSGDIIPPFLEET
jgi:uncharacterized protein (DUF362 family)